MYLVSNKLALLTIYLLAFMFSFAPYSASAETGIVNAVGSGREVSEAIVSLLRSVVGRYFKDEPSFISKAVLQNEIVPNASSFVQSYKILEGGRGNSVSIGANVDLDVIRALLRFTPSQLGEPDGAKALVIVRGARLPDSATYIPSKNDKDSIDPYLVLENAAKERLARRGFSVVVLSDEEMLALGAGDDVSSPELLRGLSARSGARIAMGISSYYESFENEHSHNKDQRIVVNVTLVDTKAASPIGRASIVVSEPKSRKEKYSIDLQKSFSEDAKDLFHEVLVQAGKRLLKEPGQTDFSIIQIQKPANALLVAKFRGLLEANKSIRSVVEYSVSRGAFDLAIRPVMKEVALAKLMKSLVSEEIVITPVQFLAQQNPGMPSYIVQLAPKESPVSSDTGGEDHNEELP